MEEVDEARHYSVPIDSEGTSNNMVGTLQTSKSQLEKSTVQRPQEKENDEDYTPDSEQPSDQYDQAFRKQSEKRSSAAEEITDAQQAEDNYSSYSQDKNGEETPPHLAFSKETSSSQSLSQKSSQVEYEQDFDQDPEREALMNRELERSEKEYTLYSGSS